MKFSGSFASLLVVVFPLLLQAAALPNVARAGFKGGFGGGFGRGGNNQNQKGAGNTQQGNNNNNNNANNATAQQANNNNNNNGGNGANNDNDAQTSLELNPAVIGSNLAQNGLGASGSEAGQAPSLTTTNNFINFCLGKTITNGLQVQGGSCNPVPMGDIPSSGAQPSCKFVSPTNGQVIAPNTNFTVTMAINNLDAGFFVNPNTNYFGAPQQLNSAGVIQGHSHIVIQAINGLDDTAVPNPQSFAFFKGLNAAAQNGQLSAEVSGGLKEGTYRIASINTAANHQPVVGPVAQHGAFDDAVYITVSNSAQQGFGNAGQGANNANAGGEQGGVVNAGNNNDNNNNNNANNSTNAGAAGAKTGAGNAGNNNANNAGATGAKSGAAGTGNKNSGATGAKTGAAGAANNKGSNAGAAKTGANNAGAANNGAKNAGAANSGKNTGANHFGAGAQQQQQQGKGRRSFNISRQN